MSVVPHGSLGTDNCSGDHAANKFFHSLVTSSPVLYITKAPFRDSEPTAC